MAWSNTGLVLKVPGNVVDNVTSDSTVDAPSVGAVKGALSGKLSTSGGTLSGPLIISTGGLTVQAGTTAVKVLTALDVLSTTVTSTSTGTFDGVGVGYSGPAHGVSINIPASEVGGFARALQIKNSSGTALGGFGFVGGTTDGVHSISEMFIGTAYNDANRFRITPAGVATFGNTLTVTNGLTASGGIIVPAGKTVAANGGLTSTTGSFTDSITVTSSTGGKGVLWGSGAANYANIWAEQSSAALVMASMLKPILGKGGFASSTGVGNYGRQAIRMLHNTGIEFFSEAQSTTAADTEMALTRRLLIAPTAITASVPVTASAGLTATSSTTAIPLVVTSSGTGTYLQTWGSPSWRGSVSLSGDLAMYGGLGSGYGNPAGGTFRFYRNTATRWQWLLANAETANAGSDLHLYRYDDAGNATVPLTVSRATGALQSGYGIGITAGGLYVNSGGLTVAAGPTAVQALTATSATFSNKVQVSSSMRVTGGGDTQGLAVVAAPFVNNHTGPVVLEMPSNLNTNNGMLHIEIRGYSYSGTSAPGLGWTLTIGGYAYAGHEATSVAPYWVNNSATWLGPDANPALPVRLIASGKASTNNIRHAIVLGDETTVWNYANLYVLVGMGNSATARNSDPWSVVKVGTVPTTTDWPSQTLVSVSRLASRSWAVAKAGDTMAGGLIINSGGLSVNAGNTSVQTLSTNGDITITNALHNNDSHAASVGYVKSTMRALAGGVQLVGSYDAAGHKITALAPNTSGTTSGFELLKPLPTASNENRGMYVIVTKPGNSTAADNIRPNGVYLNVGDWVLSDSAEWLHVDMSAHEKEVYYQDDDPSGSDKFLEGQLWIDKNDANKTYVRTASSIQMLTANPDTHTHEYAVINHGTHVSFSGTNPANLGTASPGGGSTATVAKSDHVHATVVQNSMTDSISLAPSVTAVNTELGKKQNTSARGAANGYASLGADVKIPIGQIPDLSGSNHTHEYLSVNGGTLKGSLTIYTGGAALAHLTITNGDATLTKGSLLVGEGNLTVPKGLTSLTSASAGTALTVRAGTGSTYSQEWRNVGGSTVAYMTSEGRMHATTLVAANGIAGTNRGFAIHTSGTQRWWIAATVAGESTTATDRAGSDLAVYRYRNDGASIDAPLSISRDTGIVTLLKGVDSGPGTIGGVGLGLDAPHSGVRFTSPSQNVHWTYSLNSHNGTAQTGGFGFSGTGHVVEYMYVGASYSDTKNLRITPAGDVTVGGTLSVPQPGDNDDHAATKKYVDDKVVAFAGGISLVGTYDATTGANKVASVTTGVAGITVNQALPAAAASNKGWYLIVTAGGTGSGNAPAVNLIPGDWLVSTGNEWARMDMSAHEKEIYYQKAQPNTGTGTLVGQLWINQDNLKAHVKTAASTFKQLVAEADTSLSSFTSAVGNQITSHVSSSPHVALENATAPKPLGTTTVGTASTASKSDHVHAKPSLSDLGAEAAGAASTAITTHVGNASTPHVALASTTPSALGTAAVGTGTTSARADHVHAVPTAAQVGADSAGTASTAVTNHVSALPHVALASTGTPADLGASAVLGSAVTSAKSDHVHKRPTLAELGAEAAGTASTAITTHVGNSSTPHVALASTGTPSDLGTAAVLGSAVTSARSDHVHKRPSLSDLGAEAAGTASTAITTHNAAQPHVSLSSTTPSALGTAAVGTGTTSARADHVHKLPTAGDVGAVSTSGDTMAGTLIISTGGLTVQAGTTAVQALTATSGTFSNWLTPTYLRMASDGQSEGIRFFNDTKDRVLIWSGSNKENAGLGNEIVHDRYPIAIRPTDMNGAWLSDSDFYYSAKSDRWVFEAPLAVERASGRNNQQPSLGIHVRVDSVPSADVANGAALAIVQQKYNNGVYDAGGLNAVNIFNIDRAGNTISAGTISMAPAENDEEATSKGQVSDMIAAHIHDNHVRYDTPILLYPKGYSTARPIGSGQVKGDDPNETTTGTKYGNELPDIDSLPIGTVLAAGAFGPSAGVYTVFTSNATTIPEADVPQASTWSRVPMIPAVELHPQTYGVMTLRGRIPIVTTVGTSGRTHLRLNVFQIDEETKVETDISNTDQYVGYGYGTVSTPSTGTSVDLLWMGVMDPSKTYRVELFGFRNAAVTSAKVSRFMLEARFDPSTLYPKIAGS